MKSLFGAASRGKRLTLKVDLQKGNKGTAVLVQLNLFLPAYPGARLALTGVSVPSNPPHRKGKAIYHGGSCFSDEQRHDSLPFL